MDLLTNPPASVRLAVGLPRSFPFKGKAGMGMGRFTAATPLLAPLYS